MTDFNLVDANGSVSVRSFGNAGAATRYANKHGLTVATNNGSLAIVETDDNAIAVLVEETIDSTDVDAVLASLDATDEPTQVETVTLRDRALAFDVATVDATVTALRDSFARRDAFEASNGLSLNGDSSYTRERARMMKNEIAVARFFLALAIEPCDVIERKVASNSMFNAKALKKVTELAQYAVGYGQKLEKVTRAFIACALIATDRGHVAITNDVNRKFLNGADYGSLISDQELIDYLRDQRHVAMTSGAETQSSQARNVLDVLGLGNIRTVTKSRDAVELNASHDFYSLFRASFMR